MALPNGLTHPLSKRLPSFSPISLTKHHIMHAAGGSRGGVPWRASPGLHFSHLIHDDMTHNSLSGCMGTPQLVGAWGCGGRVGLMVLCPSRTKMCQEMGKTSAHVTGRELGAWVAWLEPQKRAELGCGSWGRRAGGASPAGRTRARGTPQKPMEGGLGTQISREQFVRRFSRVRLGETSQRASHSSPPNPNHQELKPVTQRKQLSTQPLSSPIRKF